MALLTFNPLPRLFASRTSSCSASLPIAIPTVSRLSLNATDNSRSKCLIGTRFVPNNTKRLTTIVKASTESSEGEPQPPSDAAVPVEQLPLESESKKQQLLEQRLRMKQAKKIRLRRKRLDRKRKMRKKGRWPPSKMRKLKNV